MIYWFKRIYTGAEKELFLYGQEGNQVVESAHIIVDGKKSMWEVVKDDEIFVYYPDHVKSFKLQEFGVATKHDFMYLNPLRIAKRVMENYQDWKPGETFTEVWQYSEFRLILMKVADCQLISGDENDQMTHYPTFDLIGKYQIIQVPERIVEQFVDYKPAPDIVGLIVYSDSMISYGSISVGLPPGIYLMYYTRY